MKHLMFGLVTIIYTFPLLASNLANNCSKSISGYKVLKNTTYPFMIGKEKGCFFAYYTSNPNPVVDVKSNGNLGESVWYGYYKLNDKNKIYEFPKPSDDDWSSICSINAISFIPMHGNKKRDVTIIGSCEKQNAINYTFPLVFIRQGNKFILDKDVYLSLFGKISLTIADVRAYIKNPSKCYEILNGRSNLQGMGKTTCD